MVEGLQEMFAKGYSPDGEWETDYNFKDILKMVNSRWKEKSLRYCFPKCYAESDFLPLLTQLSDWKAFSSDKPFASGYLKLFGQELFFGGLDKDAIQNALQVSFRKHHHLSIKSFKILFLSDIVSLFLTFNSKGFFVFSINQGK